MQLVQMKCVACRGGEPTLTYAKSTEDTRWLTRCRDTVDCGVPMSAHPTMVQWSRVARIMDKLPDKRAKAAVFALREYGDRANLEFDRLVRNKGNS